MVGSLRLFARHSFTTMAYELLHHEIHCFQEESPFLIRAGRKFVKQVPKLLFPFINVRVKQNVRRQRQSMDDGGQNHIGGVDDAALYALEVSESPARLICKLLLRQSAAHSLGLDLIS